jgi:hypothetical protein
MQCSFARREDDLPARSTISFKTCGALSGAEPQWLKAILSATHGMTEVMPFPTVPNIIEGL